MGAAPHRYLSTCVTLALGREGGGDHLLHAAARAPVPLSIIKVCDDHYFLVSPLHLRTSSRFMRRARQAVEQVRIYTCPRFV